MPSAEILLFPQRALAEPTPEDRLRHALAALDAALEEQREAVAAFQSNLGELGDAVAGLENSLRKYACQLTATHGDALAAQEGARKLEATADGWMRNLAP